MIHVDFETRSELDVTEVGQHLYASHPSTDVVCIRYRRDNGPIHLWHPFPKHKKPPRMPRTLRQAWETGEEFAAHNKGFEEAIWAYVMNKKYGWPPVKFSHCSAAQAAYVGLPRSLEKACRAAKTKNQKDMAGKRTMLKCSMPRRPTKGDPFSKWHESPEDLNQVFKYCETDVLCESELSKVLPKLPANENLIWRLNEAMNVRGIQVDTPSVKNAIEIVKHTEQKYLKELSEITNGLVTSHTELESIHNYLESIKVHLPNLQAGTIVEALKEGIDPRAKRVLEIRQTLGLASIKKLYAMLTRADSNGIVRENLMYSGASTHRFSGSGLQIQNMPRGTYEDQEAIIEAINLKDPEIFLTLYPDPFKAISSALRGMIIAREGFVLRAFDYAAIEARVVMWLAGCEIGQQEFRNGDDSYKNLASEIFIKNLKLIEKNERFVGKQAFLGCSYQMGWPKFMKTCANLGQPVTEEIAQRAVATYRSRYKEVPMLWRELQNAAFECVLTKNPVKAAKGKITFTMHERFLTAGLPSGRLLYYWDPSIKTVETDYGPRETVHFWYVDSQTKQWVEGGIYGGLWCENFCQSIARDVMCDALLHMVKIEGKNFFKERFPLFTVHDEFVFEDRIGYGNLSELEKKLTHLEPWADGLLIKVEGWEGMRYKK